jgi:hypothetical protein
MRSFPPTPGSRPYADWSLGVTRGVGPLALELAWSDTSLDGVFGIRRGPGVNDGRLVLSLSSSLPCRAARATQAPPSGLRCAGTAPSAASARIRPSSMSSAAR